MAKPAQDFSSLDKEDTIKNFQTEEQENSGIMKATAAAETKDGESRIKGSEVPHRLTHGSSRVSDTESMGSSEGSEENVEPDSFADLPGRQHHRACVHEIESNDQYDENVETDSYVSNWGDGYIDPSQDQKEEENSGTFSSQHSVIVEGISKRHRQLKQTVDDFYQGTMDNIAVILQENEMLRLKNKDLEQQVKDLKKEKEMLMFGCRQTEDLVLKELQENLRHAVQKMYEYRERCNENEKQQKESHQLAEGAVCLDGMNDIHQPLSNSMTEPEIEPGIAGPTTWEDSNTTNITRESKSQQLSEMSGAVHQNYKQESEPEEPVHNKTEHLDIKQCKTLSGRLHPMSARTSCDDDDNDGNNDGEEPSASDKPAELVALKQFEAVLEKHHLLNKPITCNHDDHNNNNNNDDGVPDGPEEIPPQQVGLNQCQANPNKVSLSHTPSGNDEKEEPSNDGAVDDKDDDGAHAESDDIMCHQELPVQKSLDFVEWGSL